jgi:hypothetical protein
LKEQRTQDYSERETKNLFSEINVLECKVSKLMSWLMTRFRLLVKWIEDHEDEPMVLFGSSMWVLRLYRISRRLERWRSDSSNKALA